MSWAKEAKKISKTLSIDFDGTNNEGWVPNRGRYPHVHFGSNFIRYRHAIGAGGSVLANGQNLLPPINDIIKELGDGDVRRVLTGLLDVFDVG